jgi:serine/threonine-protein kinase
MPQADSRLRRYVAVSTLLETVVFRKPLDHQPHLKRGFMEARMRLRIRRSAAIVAAVALAHSTAVVATADQIFPAGGGWQSYVNDRYGTRLDFPDVFVPDAPPENGDGRRFQSADASMEVYAWSNSDGETAASLEQRLVGAEGYTEVTYSPSGRDWLVLSGYRGDTIFYEKYFFRGDTVQGFGMEFPAAEKPRYAPIIERIEDSFQAG